MEVDVPEGDQVPKGTQPVGFTGKPQLIKELDWDSSDEVSNILGHEIIGRFVIVLYIMYTVSQTKGFWVWDVFNFNFIVSDNSNAALRTVSSDLETDSTVSVNMFISFKHGYILQQSHTLLTSSGVLRQTSET